MGRRDESPEKKRRRALIGEFLKETPIKDGNDIIDEREKAKVIKPAEKE